VRGVLALLIHKKWPNIYFIQHTARERSTKTQHTRYKNLLYSGCVCLAALGRSLARSRTQKVKCYSCQRIINKTHTEVVYKLAGVACMHESYLWWLFFIIYARHCFIKAPDILIKCFSLSLRGRALCSILYVHLKPHFIRLQHNCK
jgi:hypothetical protein